MKRRLMAPLIFSAACLMLAWPHAGHAAKLSGSSRTSLDLSWSDADNSSEDKRGALFSEYLRVEVDQLPYEAVVFTSGQLKWDIGGESSDSIYYTHLDNGSKNYNFLLYEAGVTLEPASWAELTAGRFDWRSAENVHLDGAALSVTPFSNVELSAFGGQIVQLYDELEDDEIYGLGLKARLPFRATFKVDYMNYFDDLLRVELRGVPYKNLFVKTDAEWVDGDLREASIKGQAWVESTKTRLLGGVRKKIGNARDADYLFDYTTDADETKYRIERLNLLRENPYNQYEAAVEQDVFVIATVSVRYIKRDLIDEPVYENSANTSFDVYSIGLSLREPQVKGLFLEGRYSWWREERIAGSESESSSLLLSAEQQFTEKLSAYAAYYRKDEDTNNQLENSVAQSASIGVEYKSGSRYAVSAQFTQETDDLYEELYGIDNMSSFVTRLTINL